MNPDQRADTSRYPSTDAQYGSRGDFIASLAALSVVSVTSRHRAHEFHNTVTLRQAKVVSRNLPSLPEHRLLNFSHGTRVTVRDLFGSMAVRVKQRPAANDSVAVEKEFGRLLRQIVAVVLAWPTSVSIKLKDSTTRNEFRLRPSRNGSLPDARLSGRVHRVLVQSGLADDTASDTWVSVGASARDISVKGCISLNPAATKRAQFISFGIHPIAEEQGRNVLFDEVNRVFASSDFALQDDVGDGQVRQHLVERELRPRKTLERWPMFYFRIEALSKELETVMDSPEALLGRPQRLSHAEELLTMLCFEFLKKHHFQPREVPRTSRSSRKPLRTPSAAGRDETASATSGTSGSSTPNQRPASPFDFWQRVKVGSAIHSMSRSIMASSKLLQPRTFDADAQSLEDGNRARKSETQPTRSIIEKNGECLRPLSADATSPSCQQAHKLPVESTVAETPRVGTPESRDRTGPVSEGSCNREDMHSVSGEGEESLEELATHTPQDAATLNKEPSEWLQGMLSAWETSIFSATEAPIPKIEGTTVTSAVESDRSRPNLADPSAFNLSAVRLQGRLSKGALANAEVISQVDQKYILIKMCPGALDQMRRQGSQDQSLLVLVDQHAADERCRLEALMRDYFFRDDRGRLRAQTAELKSTLKFEFDARETDLLRRFSHRFEHWGIRYEFAPGRIHEYFPKSKHPRILEVVSLPPAISERGRTEPRLVSDLLRNEIWKLEESGGLVQVQTQSAARGEADWVSHFQGCPQGILDLLNSRSCRGKFCLGLLKALFLTGTHQVPSCSMTF